MIEMDQGPDLEEQTFAEEDEIACGTDGDEVTLKPGQEKVQRHGVQKVEKREERFGMAAGLAARSNQLE